MGPPHTSESTLSLITTSPSTLHLIYFSFSRLLDQINRFHLHPPHLCPGRSVHVRDNILDLSVILGFIQLPSTPANLTNSLQSAIMSVEIEPTELAFTRPFTTEVSQSLKIRNSNRTPVAFKVCDSLEFLRKQIHTYANICSISRSRLQPPSSTAHSPRIHNLGAIIDEDLQILCPPKLG